MVTIGLADVPGSVVAVAGNQPPRLTPDPIVHTPAAMATTAATFDILVRETRRSR